MIEALHNKGSWTLLDLAARIVVAEKLPKGRFLLGLESTTFYPATGELPQELRCKLKEGPEVKELTLRGQQMEEEVKLIEEEMDWSDDEEYEIESEIEDFDPFL